VISKDRPPLSTRISSGTTPEASRAPRPASSLFPQGVPQARALSGARDREFEFSEADFERIRKLIYDHAGIALPAAKHDMVYSRLTRRLRACGDKTFAQYLTRLERDRTEWESFVNSLTTNLTAFFREAHHFDILAERMKAIGTARTINIWCCAASTGEEPYSLAMTACETFKTLAPPVRIIASDVNTSVLAHGERGEYGADRVTKLRADQVQQFFVRQAGAGADVYRVKSELQRLITFRRINLLEPAWPVQGPLDAIFCRNVMIYFDKPTQYAILKRFAPLLRPEGAMFAGHSESFIHAADVFRPLGRTVYQRVDRP
jgi:chemotaxis protein methyltransferase CheR